MIQHLLDGQQRIVELEAPGSPERIARWLNRSMKSCDLQTLRKSFKYACITE